MNWQNFGKKWVKVKEFRKWPSNTQLKATFREVYKIKQGIFDKHFRNTERVCNTKFADYIEDTNTNDPVQSWNQINRLGPQKKSEIPMSVMWENGSVSNEFDIVMDTWKSDFSNLYNPLI